MLRELLVGPGQRPRLPRGKVKWRAACLNSECRRLRPQGYKHQHPIKREASEGPELRPG